MYPKEFNEMIHDIVSTDAFQKMKECRHHVKSNLYKHSVLVAYLCYKHHKKHKTKINLREFIMGALLHDYYLYDLHNSEKKHRFHWFRHPKKALKQAAAHYPDLTAVQKDMILHHMFPLTFVPPRTRAGLLVCFYDKIAAVRERIGKSFKIKGEI